MNRQETIQVITLLAGNYDSIAKKDKTQKSLMIDTWLECLGDLDYKIVLNAVKKTIINSSYPPTIHEVRRNAIEIVNPSNSNTPVEAWNEAYKMICRGSVITEEEFQRHSEEVKMFFGSVRQVRELAKSDINSVNTVVKGQFLKQYEILQQRKREQKLLPTDLQTMVLAISEK